jgi:predicted dinucleotide-utilizing enzyme
VPSNGISCIATEPRRAYHSLPPKASQIAYLSELDEQINRTLHEAYAVGDKATQAYSESVDKLSELERLIRTCLQATVNELIAKSNSTIVTNALREALKSTILKVRPASREDLKSGDDVLIVRQASPAELRQQ